MALKQVSAMGDQSLSQNSKDIQDIAMNISVKDLFQIHIERMSIHYIKLSKHIIQFSKENEKHLINLEYLINLSSKYNKDYDVVR